MEKLINFFRKRRIGLAQEDAIRQLQQAQEGNVFVCVCAVRILGMCESVLLSLSLPFSVSLVYSYRTTLTPHHAS